MKADKDFILGYKMLDYRKIKKSAVRKSVRNKIDNSKGEVIVMKMSKLKKLAIAGAVAAVTVVSFTTVNAATDGAVMDKITETITNVRLKINGEEVEVPAVVKEVGDDYVEMEIEVSGDDNDELTVEYDGDFDISQNSDDPSEFIIEEN